jgi:hypothetical protein
MNDKGRILFRRPHANSNYQPTNNLQGKSPYLSAYIMDYNCANRCQSRSPIDIKRDFAAGGC